MLWKDAETEHCRRDAPGLSSYLPARRYYPLYIMRVRGGHRASGVKFPELLLVRQAAAFPRAVLPGGRPVDVGAVVALHPGQPGLGIEDAILLDGESAPGAGHFKGHRSAPFLEARLVLSCGTIAAGALGDLLPGGSLDDPFLVGGKHPTRLVVDGQLAVRVALYDEQDFPCLRRLVTALELVRLHVPRWSYKVKEKSSA